MLTLAEEYLGSAVRYFPPRTLHSLRTAVDAERRSFRAALREMPDCSEEFLLGGLSTAGDMTLV